MLEPRGEPAGRPAVRGRAAARGDAVLGLQPTLGNQAVNRLRQRWDMRARTLQRFPIRTRVDPLKPTHTKEKTVDTDAYTFAQLVEILISRRNAPYVDDGSFRDLGRHLAGAGAAEWRALIAAAPNSVRSAVTVLRKLDVDTAAITAGAAAYIRGLGVDEPFEERAFFAAKALAGLPEEETAALLERAKRQVAEAREQAAVAKRGALLAEAGHFLQIAAYFWAEIPDAVADARFDFLQLTAEWAARVGLHESPAASPISEELLAKMIADVQAAARRVVELAEGKRAPVPSTFEGALPASVRDPVMRIRAEVQRILQPIAAEVARLLPQGALRYRGSLTDAAKNYNKSTPLVALIINARPEDIDVLDYGKRATPVNTAAYDIDAFIEVADSQWEAWEQAGLIPERKEQAIKGKVLLEAWVEDLAKSTKPGAADTLVLARALRALEQRAQTELAQLAGYKRREDGISADFDMALQPARKSRHEVEYGKPYPRGELSRGGSALQELMARYKLLQEQQLNVPASWIPETHQTIDPSLATQAPASAEVTRL